MLKFAAGMATGLVAGFWCGQFWAFSRFIAGEAAKMDTAIAEIRAGQAARDRSDLFVGPDGKQWRRLNYPPQ